MLIYRSRRETGENKKKIRVWRSLVSRLNGVQEASSSNLDTRTKTEDRKIFGLFLFEWFYIPNFFIHRLSLKVETAEKYLEIYITVMYNGNSICKNILS